jgi:1,4-dihydroxy-2-naphthoate octaprenyltransferase
MMAAFYPLVALCVVVGAMPGPALAVVIAIPRLAKVWRRFDGPRPDRPPPGFPVWPLWYAALAWVHVRQAGALLVLGLAVGALL